MQTGLTSRCKSCDGRSVWGMQISRISQLLNDFYRHINTPHWTCVCMCVCVCECVCVCVSSSSAHTCTLAVSGVFHLVINPCCVKWVSVKGQKALARALGTCHVQVFLCVLVHAYTV